MTQVSVDEGMIGVHKYRPVTGSFRVKWVLAFLNEEGAVEENGTRPVIERIKLKEVVTKADISRDGVLAASTSRKLDKAGYRLFEERGRLTSGISWVCFWPSCLRPRVFRSLCSQFWTRKLHD